MIIWALSVVASCDVYSIIFGGGPRCVDNATSTRTFGKWYRMTANSLHFLGYLVRHGVPRENILAFFNDAMARAFGHQFVDWEGKRHGKDQMGNPYVPDVPITCDSHAYKSDVAHSISQLAQRVTQNDVLIVYLRSHGYGSQVGGLGFASPHGRRWDYDTFLNLIAKVPARTVFLIAEGCWSCGIQASALAKFADRHFLLLCSSPNPTRHGAERLIAVPRTQGRVRFRVSGELLPVLLEELDGADAPLGAIAQRVAGRLPRAQHHITPGSLFPRRDVVLRPRRLLTAAIRAQLRGRP